MSTTDNEKRTTQITLKPGTTFDGYWLNYIVNEAKRLMHDEFKDIFDNLPDTLEDKRLKFSLVDDLFIFCDERMSSLDEVNSETLSRALASHKQEHDNAMFQAEFCGKLDKEIFVLTYIGLQINTSVLYKIIMREFDRIDLMKECITLTLRHELGHIIDFISYHGKPWKTVMKIRDRYIDEKKEYFKSWEGKPFSQELSIKYQELEEESVANTNGHVDVKRAREVEELMASSHKDCSIVINIDVCKIDEDKIEEKEKDE